jgi:hypothetical protein
MIHPQDLLTGVNPSVLNRHGAYNLGDVGFPLHTPHPFQPMVLCFPPKYYIWSVVYKILPTIPKLKTKELMAAT